ncbi:MAG: DUF1853 family protein [Janthinobacterium lividum]
MNVPSPADADDCFAPRDPAGAGGTEVQGAAAGAASPGAARSGTTQCGTTQCGTTQCGTTQCDFAVPAVRDLCWLMCSPALLSPSLFGDQLAAPVDSRCFGPDAPAGLQRLLARLDADPAPLLDALGATPERRLGRYAEGLLAVWLQQMPDVDVVALGLPIRDAGRTLGECDALFRTAQGGRQHWEMAVKFYLRIDDVSPETPDSPFVPARRESIAADPFAGCDAYVGAGLADRLDWKLRRLVEHQMRLSERAELVTLGGGAWQARMFVKGRLFHPLAQWRDRPAGEPDAFMNAVGRDGMRHETDIAPALAPDHLRGWWATYDEWCGASARSALRWTPLARLEWLAPLPVASPLVTARAQSAAGFANWLAEYFAHAPGVSPAPDGAQPRTGRPIQVAALERVPGAGVDALGEASRGFIVPNDWPERARRFRHTGQRHHQR